MLTFEDFRTISVYLEMDENGKFYNLITKNLSNLSLYEKIVNTIELRMRCIDESIVLASKEGNSININLKLFLSNFKKSFHPIKKILEIDGFKITVDYPQEFYYDNYEHRLMDCVKYIQYFSSSIDYENLSFNEKCSIFENLPPKIISYINNYISTSNYDISLIDSKLVP
jgi:hypothetical protein